MRLIDADKYKFEIENACGFSAPVQKDVIRFCSAVADNMPTIDNVNNRYDWHDLRKNPDDLPKNDGAYWVHGIWGSGKRAEGECEFKVHDGYFNASWNFNVIAWKEVEPFEEVE